MSPARTRTLAWALFAAAVVAIVASGVLLVLALDAPDPAGSFGFRGFSSIYALAFAIVGLLVALRRPENPIGWMMLVSGGLAGALQQVAQQYATWTILGEGSGPGGELGAWAQDWLWLPQVTTLGVSLLLIPDGRLPSPRWRVVVWTLVVSVVVAMARVVVPGPIESFRDVRNPFGIEGARDVLEALSALGLAGALASLLATAVSLARRRRHAVGDERAQVSWVAFGGLLVTTVFVVYGVVYGIANTGVAVDVMEVVFVAAVIVFAATFGIAILRFRLFDVDVVVTKTVVVGLLASFITAVYVGIVVGIGALVGSRGDAVLSAVAAALVALAFQPVRRRAQRIADRFVYGERANPYEVLSGFSHRVAEAYGAEDVPERMARILAEGTSAARAEVWLRVGSRLELAAAWPAGEARAPRRLEAGDLPAMEGAPTAVAVRHEGELLGALTVTKPPSDPITATEARLVEDLASQAGLVLRNAALIAELRASRQRLVAAQDEERRRLERNLHDGAQQQLVALSVKLGLLRRVAGDALPDAAAAMIDELQAEAGDALENLRDLARGIFPPLLADRGLPDALAAQARKAAVPVEIRAEGVGRYPKDVEAAVYFCCLEALQNVAKYASASRASVRLREDGRALVFEVEDDGVGFDVAAAEGSGSGLQGIRDRLAALGGALEIRSAPGAGTILAGRVPLP